ncbi:MAG: MmgE/PrpD family protein [Candidatus Micrarchaeaceae archaeon]
MRDLVFDIVETYSHISFNDIPYETIDYTKKFILDTIGVALAGTVAPGTKTIFDLFKSFEKNGENHVIGFKDKLSRLNATFVNSILCHALDFDDTLDDAAMHCYASVLPAAMTLGEINKINGKNFITSIILGVDLACRLGLAVTTPLSWIRTATCGSFGSALAAAKVLNLHSNQILNALGIVYSQTSGNAQCLIDGGLTKRMQPAFSSKAGVLSAMMAEKGITGAMEVFEGRYGFFNLYERGLYNREMCIRDLGKLFYGDRLSIKPYPTCRMTHSSIDAAIEILKKLPSDFDLSDLDKVEISVCEMAKDMVGKPFEIRNNPQVDAQFSIPYNVSVVLMKKGAPFIEDLSNETVVSGKWNKIVEKIEVKADKDIEANNIKSSYMRVILKSGKEFAHQIKAPKGNPVNPMSWDECILKFKKCANSGIVKFSSGDLESIIEQIMKLDKLEDVSFLFNKI